MNRLSRLRFAWYVVRLAIAEYRHPGPALSEIERMRSEVEDMRVIYEAADPEGVASLDTDNIVVYDGWDFDRGEDHEPNPI